jgi:hypothetical protein
MLVIIVTMISSLRDDRGFYGPGVESVTNINEYQGGKGRPVCRSDKFTAICEPIV